MVTRTPSRLTGILKEQDPWPEISKDAISDGPGIKAPGEPPEERDQLFVESKNPLDDAIQYLFMVSRYKKKTIPIR